jgi:hypothetical protein
MLRQAQHDKKKVEGSAQQAFVVILSLSKDDAPNKLMLRQAQHDKKERGESGAASIFCHPELVEGRRTEPAHASTSSA